MSRSRKILLVVCSLAATVLVVVILAGPPLLRSFLYPTPYGLPSVVDDTTEHLLSRLQWTLETKAPLVAQSLQPGLSDAQISELEAQGGFRLSDDIRALYRWHNGMRTNDTVGLLPGQRFLPLSEVVADHALMRQQSGLAFSLFAGHRKGWLHVLDDGTGDGYFFDPQRKDTEGAFFFHYSGVGLYVWFPSLRNFLSGAIECYQTQAIKLATDGKSLDEDADATREIWSKLGNTAVQNRF